MSPNVATVRALFDAFQRGGVDALIARTDPDVTWYPGSAGGQPLHGHEALRRHYTALAAHGVALHVRMDDLEEIGESVLVRGSLRVERWGSLSESTMVWLYRMRDGRVREARTFCSRTDALAALGSYAQSAAA